MSNYLRIASLTAIAVLVPLLARQSIAVQADRANHECRRARSPIVLDGKLDEPAWKRAEPLTLAVAWENRPARTRTTARLLWDDQAIYFAGEMEDADLYADIAEHNGMCWLNDVFELFFKPDDSLKYYEFQVNAAGTHLEMFLPSRGAGGYLRFGKKDVKLGMVTKVILNGTLNRWEDKDAGWNVEGKIPWTAFTATGGKPNPGDLWRFTLCRYDYSVGFERAETSTTAPLTRADFHRYEDYAKLKFVE
jgi:hypothetical protein